jgi:serine protease Do
MKLATLRVLGVIAVAALGACSKGPPPVGQLVTPSPSPEATEMSEAPGVGAAAPQGSGAVSDQARIVAAVRTVKASVVALDVTINGTQVVPANPLLQLFSGRGGAKLQNVQEQASGSGFVYDSSGVIVTNDHVVHGASSIQVIFANGDRVNGSIYAEDQGADLALVKVNNYAHLPPPLTLGASNQVQQGEWAIAFGEPFALQQTVTVGVVSGFNRSEMIAAPGGATRQFKGLLQTSAPINPGNSGGPLTDMDGRVIGVNQSVADPASGAQGIGFAIPVDAMKATVANLEKHPGLHTGMSSGFIGVQLVALNDNVRQQLGYDGDGVVIVGVIDGSAADKAGLQPGDVIQQIDGGTVMMPDDVTNALAKTHPGQTVHLGIWRGGSTRTVAVQVTAAPLPAGG